MERREERGEKWRGEERREVEWSGVEWRKTGGQFKTSTRRERGIKEIERRKERAKEREREKKE